MTHYIALCNLASGKDYEIVEAETFDAVMNEAAAAMGGHPAIAEGSVRSRSGFGGYYHRQYDNRDFWYQVMADIYDGLDNQNWFLSTSREDVIAQALAFRHPADEEALS